MVTCLSCANVADNFVEDILGDFKFEVASPYILYRSKSDEVLHPIRTQTLSLLTKTRGRWMPVLAGYWHLVL